MPLPPEMTEGQDDRLDGLPIHYATTQRENPEGMVVLMPSALSAKREDRTKKIFTRSTWVSSWPDAEVISVTDPAVQQDESLDGAWFIHPIHDVIKALSEFVGQRASAAGISPDRVVFYGSSLGGFGAIGAAAHLPGARAVAEVPQIDFANWFPSAVRKVEQCIIGMPLEEYREIHPEQIALQQRLELAGRIPEFKILTNPTDPRIEEQREFFAWAQNCGLPESGPIEILESTRTAGHKVLGRKDLSPHVQP